MKRDMDLIRRMVLAVRDSNTAIDESHFSDVPCDVFIEHTRLLVEANLIDAKVYSGGAILLRLTWNGQDFASSVSDDSIWKNASEKVLKPTVSWSFGVLLEYLKQSALSGVSVG